MKKKYDIVTAISQSLLFLAIIFTLIAKKYEPLLFDIPLLIANIGLNGWMGKDK